jgi:RNA polymerase sigma-70 factor, ECF subfamily
MTVTEVATAAHPAASSTQCRQEKSVGDGFAQEIDLLSPRLRHYALSLTRNKSAADDLVQETMVRGIEKIHLWRAGTNLRAWLFTILHNLYVNGVRRAAREAARVELIHAEAPLVCPPSQTERLELRDLERGVAKLPEEQRSVVLLIGFEDRPYETVAALLDIPVGTVRSRLSRGRTSLRILTDRAPAPRSRRSRSRGSLIHGKTGGARGRS